MDLNELLYHHQVALIRKAHCPSGKGARANFDLVQHYAKRIKEHRHINRLQQYKL